MESKGPLPPPTVANQSKKSNVSNPANFFGSKYWGAKRNILGRLKTREAKTYATEKRKFEEQQERNQLKAKESYDEAKKTYKSTACDDCRKAEALLKQNRTLASYLLRKNLDKSTSIFNVQSKKVEKAKNAERDAQIALLEKQIKTREKDINALNKNSKNYSSDKKDLEEAKEKQEAQLKALRDTVRTRSWSEFLQGKKKMTQNERGKGEGIKAAPPSQWYPEPKSEQTVSLLGGGRFSRRSSPNRRGKKTRRH